MEVLEAIQKRRTVRVPFKEEKISDDILGILRQIAPLSPGEDPVSWQVIGIDERAKPELVRIVREDFGAHFQKNSQRFRQVFSRYPRWLRFSKATDGIRLARLPKIASYFYRVALGPGLGPFFGKLGIMNAEIRSYCRNILATSALFGVFLDKRLRSGMIAPIINAGSMLQNLRLATVSLGLCYQDLGWITATKTGADKARELAGLSGNHVAINFFRIGRAEDLAGQDKVSDFRRDLKEIVHIGDFGNKTFQAPVFQKTAMHVLDTIRGQNAARESGFISESDLSYLLEAARWTPTGFNVQPFEYVVEKRENAATLTVLENRDRRDPDPGPCEALARGAVLQNVRLAARALGLSCTVRPATIEQSEKMHSEFCLPGNFKALARIEVGAES